MWSKTRRWWNKALPVPFACIHVPCISICSDSLFVYHIIVSIPGIMKENHSLCCLSGLLFVLTVSLVVNRFVFSVNVFASLES